MCDPGQFQEGWMAGWVVLPEPGEACKVQVARVSKFGGGE